MSDQGPAACACDGQDTWRTGTKNKQCNHPPANPGVVTGHLCSEAFDQRARRSWLLRFNSVVSLRQTCMKSFDVLANLVVEFNPMRSTADGHRSKCRATGWSWRKSGADRAAQRGHFPCQWHCLELRYQGQRCLGGFCWHLALLRRAEYLPNRDCAYQHGIRPGTEQAAFDQTITRRLVDYVHQHIAVEQIPVHFSKARRNSSIFLSTP